MKNKDVGLIYLAICRVNGKGYIGKTTDIESRKKYHNAKSSRCRLLKRAINKYGMDCFDWHIIEHNVPEEDLNARETFWIASLNTIAPNGYNLTWGGEGGRKSEETKRKMSEARKGKKHTEEAKQRMSESMKGRSAWNKGIPRSEETKDKIKKTNTGKRHKPETIEKLRRIFKGRPSPMKGKKWTEEQKAKLRGPRRNKKSSKYQLELF